MIISIIDNLSTENNHLARLKDLLKECDSVILTSPFLMTDFTNFFSNGLCDNLKSIHLITTLKPNSIDQIKKISSLVSLIENKEIKRKGIQCKISLNNKLHGKIYIFKKLGVSFSAIISSANLTDSGLSFNHEWGIEFSDLIQIDTLEKTLIDCIEPQFESLSTSVIYRMQQGVKDYLNKQSNPIEMEIDLNLTEIISETEGQINNEEQNQIQHKSKSPKTNEYKITQQYLDSWNGYFQEFLVFKTKHNEVTVPRDYPNYSLYIWYRKQKVFYANGTIPLEHKEQLEKVGFYFGDGHEIRWAKIWEENYGLLQAYYDEYGNSDVPHTRDNKDTFYSLGNWVAAQRTYNNDEILSDYKIEKLNDLDFIWSRDDGDGLRNKQWMEQFDALKKWKEKYENCNPPQINKDGSQSKLGRWLNDQRVLQRKGKKKSDGTIRFLEKDRELMLIELGVDFDYEENKHRDSFEKQIQAFLSYKFQYPDLNPPTGTFVKERENLAQWRHKFNNLPSWKQDRLIELNII
jgi:HKD family nuclease